MRLGSNYRVQVSKRVHVSRIVLTPLSVTYVILDKVRFSSVPNGVAHCASSSCVTASTEVPMLAPSSLARIPLSCLHAIAVTHY